MAGRGYAVFDTAIGRCGMVWSDLGIVGVQLPEAREIDTRRRLFRVFPEAREQRPPLNCELAIEGIVATLRGKDGDFSDVTLDMTGILPFNQRVYEFTRAIPRGETRTYTEVAAGLRMSGALHSVTQALAKNPFMIVVPCHRVLAAGNKPGGFSANGGVVTKLKMLEIEGAVVNHTPSLFD